MADDVATPNAEDRVDPATLDVGTDAADVENVPGAADPAQDAGFWKGRYTAQRQSAEENTRKIGELERQLQQEREQREALQLRSQSAQFYPTQQFAPPQAQQPQQPQPQVDARGYTPEMRARLAGLDSEADPEAVRSEIQEQAAINREQMGQANLVQMLGLVGQMSQEQQLQQGVLQRHQDILSDPSVQKIVLQEAFRIQGDPVDGSTLRNPQAVTQVNTPSGPVNVNPYALDRAAQIYRTRSEAFKEAGSASGVIGSPQSSGSEPGQRAPMSWNPMVHLSRDERTAFADLDEDMKGAGVSLKAYWNSLPRELRELRLRLNKPISVEQWRSGMYEE